MKKTLRFFVLGAAFLLPTLPVALRAQTGPPVGHTVSTSWTETDTTSGITFTVYRATGACGASGQIFAAVKAGITTTNFDDTGTNNAGVPTGVYCYRVTASLNSAESAPSNTFAATIAPPTPINFTVTIK